MKNNTEVVEDTATKLSKFYELIAVILSKKEYREVLNSLGIKHTCRNCTAYCCGGLNVEQAEDCTKWYSASLVNQLRNMKNNNPIRFCYIIMEN